MLIFTSMAYDAFRVTLQCRRRLFVSASWCYAYTCSFRT